MNRPPATRAAAQAIAPPADGERERPEAFERPGMPFAYADPAYPRLSLATCSPTIPDFAGEVDHRALIDRLEGDYPETFEQTTLPAPRPSDDASTQTSVVDLTERPRLRADFAPHKQPEGRSVMNDSANSYTERAVVDTVREQHDFGGWLAEVPASASAELGSTAALTAGRPGSWEADLVQQRVRGTGGRDDDLDHNASRRHREAAE